MNDSNPIRVFIGTSSSEWLPARVLEYSILISTRANVECVRLGDVSRVFPLPLHKKNQPRTPFSFQRFLIPELCNYEGKAIYLDADMLVLHDINQIWQMSFDDSELLYVENRDRNREPQFSVMLLDCSKLAWNLNNIIDDLNAGTYTYDSLMYRMSTAKNPSDRLPWIWNSMEHYEADVALLHYTDMNVQPWVSKQNPNGKLWIDYLRRAIVDKFISLEDVRAQVERGNVRPSILIELQSETYGMNLVGGFQDLFFRAPYKKIRNGLISRIHAKLSASFS